MAIKIKINKKHQELSDACCEGNIARVKALIDEGLDLREIWTADVYPLVIAQQSGSVELARLLIEHGMPLYWNSKYSYRSLDYSEYMPAEDEVRQRLLFGRFDEDSLAVSLALLDYADQVNVAKAGYSGLYSVSELENKYTSEVSDEYVRRLLEMGADVDHLNPEGESLLHLLVLGKNDKYVEQFIRLSKNINQLTPGGMTPLMRAVIGGRLKAIRVLLECGARVDYCDFYNKTSVLDDLIWYRDRNSYKNRDGAIDQVVELMRAHGAKTYAEMVRDGDIEEVS
ncbi:MAG: ankyrin repeat domain-containing protein [Aquipseudomonas alcaligenes]|uniref:Ankyrin repeat domain-containing protein n=1 Tax=Aquipseudomonas alcaligenes TaxID=43263 RepID=A0A5C7VS22_AQUAC|nr:MAG: ankyrin repeat domain-containing protein [Pseudomonas alcaligenes]